MMTQETYNELIRAKVEAVREGMEKSYFGLNQHFDAAELARQDRMRRSYEPVWLKAEESKARSI